MNPLIGVSDAGPLAVQQVESNPVAQAGSDFSKVIKSTINQVVEAEKQSEKAIEELQAGEAKNLHDVMISVEQADISLKMLVQFRNKALQAYEEVMRMQI